MNEQAQSVVIVSPDWLQVLLARSTLKQLHALGYMVAIEGGHPVILGPHGKGPPPYDLHHRVTALEKAIIWTLPPNAEELWKQAQREAELLDRFSGSEAVN